MTPQSLPALKKTLPRFREWLLAAGAEILEPTNPYEVLRFKAHAETSVIYRKESGALTWSGKSAEAHGYFSKGEPWKATEKTQPINLRKKSPTVKTLLARDGNCCFYCRHEMPDDDRTIEHLVPRAHGGPNHISNYVLAHQQCNRDAGHLSAMEKIKRREAAFRGES